MNNSNKIKDNDIQQDDVLPQGTQLLNDPLQENINSILNNAQKLSSTTYLTNDEVMALNINTNQLQQPTIMDFFISNTNPNISQSTILGIDNMKEISQSIMGLPTNEDINVKASLSKSKLSFGSFENDYLKYEDNIIVPKNEIISLKNQNDTLQLRDYVLNKLPIESDFQTSIGPISSLEHLLEMSKGNNVLLKNEIEKKYEGFKNIIYKWRKIKGDGNCYYRAIIFCYLEMLILTGKVDDFKDFVVDILRIYKEKKMQEILNLYKINGKGVISCVLLIYFILASGDERSVEYAYSYLIKSFNNSPHFDYGLILYFRYILYKFLSANENKCYNKDFAVLLGNLLPNEYETAEGTFMFKKFYDEFLLKLYKDAEKIIIYMTPYVLKINLHILILDEEAKSLQKMEFFQPMEDTDNFSNIITILYRGSHFDISYNETFYSKFKDYLVMYNFEDFAKKQEKKKKELEKEIALQKAEEDRLKKIYMEKKAAKEIMEKQKNENKINGYNNNNEVKNIKQNVVIDPKTIKQNVVVEPNNIKQNVVVEPKNIKQNVVIDTKNKKQNVVVDPKNIKQNVVVDPNNIKQNVVADPNNIKQNVIIGQENLKKGVIIEQNNLKPNVFIKQENVKQNVIIDPKKKKQTVVIEQNENIEQKNKKENINELKSKKENINEPKNKKEIINEPKSKKERLNPEKKQEEDKDDKISIIDPIETKRKVPQSIKMVINDSNQEEDKKSCYSRLNHSIRVPKSEYGDGVEYNLNTSYQEDDDGDDIEEFGTKTATNFSRINDLHNSVIFNGNKFINKQDLGVKRGEIKKKFLKENTSNSINFKKNSILSINEDVIDNNNSVIKKKELTLKTENINNVNIKKSLTMSQKHLSSGKNVKNTPISNRLRKYLRTRKEKPPKKGIAKENLEIKAKIEARNNFKAEEVKEKVKESKKVKPINKKELINKSDLISLSTQVSLSNNSEHYKTIGITRAKKQVELSVKKCKKCQKELKYDNGYQLCNKCLLSMVEKILLDRYALFIKDNRSNSIQSNQRFKKIYFSSDILNYNDIKIATKESSLEKITEIYNNHLENGEKPIESTKLVKEIENKVCVNCFKSNKKDNNPIILPCPCTICSEKCFLGFLNFVIEALGSTSRIDKEYTCLCNKTYSTDNLLALKDIVKKQFPNDKKYVPLINQHLSNNYCSSCKKKTVNSRKVKESIYGVDCFPDNESKVGKKHYLCGGCFKSMRNKNYPLFEGKTGQLNYFCKLCDKEHFVQKIENMNNSNGEECLIF